MKLDHIITKLFLTSLGLTLTLNSSFGSSITTCAEDYSTPNRNTEREDLMQELALTEGQKVSQAQADVLNYQRLYAALGEDFLSFTTNYFLTTDTVDIEEKWNNIFSPSIPYNDATKRNIIHKISEFLSAKQRKSAEINELKANLFDLGVQTRNVPLTRIEESTKIYFESRFSGSSVNSSMKKKSGDQLGCVAEVTLSNNQVLTYFVKTHSEGLKSGHSSAAKLVNPAELLVYKILETLGIGCESHFFGRDGKNLYIATLDANVEGSFMEYEHFKQSQDTDVQSLLWGSLTQLPMSAQFSEDQHQQAESLVASNGTAKNFVFEVTKLDLIARILGLEDFQTNPKNYGFTLVRNQGMKAKAVDFRVPNKSVEEFEKDEKSFQAFLNGNGEFDYSSTGAVMYYSLNKRKESLRVEEAFRVINSTLSNFIEAVDKSYESVYQVLLNIPMESEDKIRNELNLKKYSDIIKKNFLVFKNLLTQYRSNTEEIRF